MNISIPPKVCVIGWPIKHSRSPLIHNYWLRQHRLSGSYEKNEVTPEGLSKFMQSLRDGTYIGCNVTIPHKENVGRWLDEIDPLAQKSGSLNTIYWENNKLKATSTDGEGFFQNLLSHQPDYQLAERPVVILGAGGSARAIANTLAHRGAREISVCNRTASRAELLVKAIGNPTRCLTQAELPQVLQNAGLVINTTSAGLADMESLILPWHSLHHAAIVADIVYTPLITPLLVEAQKRGHPIVPGLGMLLHQAVAGFEKWFGTRPEVTPELHDLVARDIDPEYTR